MKQVKATISIEVPLPFVLDDKMPCITPTQIKSEIRGMDPCIIKDLIKHEMFKIEKYKFEKSED